MSELFADTNEKLPEKPKTKETISKWALPILRAYISLAENERKTKNKIITKFPNSIKAMTIKRKVGKGRTEIKEAHITQAQASLPLLGTAKKRMTREAQTDIEKLIALSTIRMALSKDKNGILLAYQKPKPRAVIEQELKKRQERKGFFI